MQEDNASLRDKLRKRSLQTVRTQRADRLLGVFAAMCEAADQFTYELDEETQSELVKMVEELHHTRQAPLLEAVGEVSDAADFVAQVQQATDTHRLVGQARLWIGLEAGHPAPHLSPREQALGCFTSSAPALARVVATICWQEEKPFSCDMALVSVGGDWMIFLDETRCLFVTRQR